MVARYREKTTLPSNCRATFCGKFKVFTKWGGLPQSCGVKERIAAPMMHDHPGQVPAAGAGRAGVACVVEGKAGSADFSGVKSDVVRPRHCQQNSIISEKKQPFMMDFSASGFTSQRALRRVIGAFAVSGVTA
jgi:hypothetical protein